MSDTVFTKEIVDEAIKSGYRVAIPSDYTQTPYPFRPVKCTEESINNGLIPAENFVYFTTDTKKIFLGQKDSFLPMCSASGIFYGHKGVSYENTGGTLPDPNVTFYWEEIEGEEIPEVDDLILNIGIEGMLDGCFYRVKEIDEEGIRSERLTLQGGGGGGMNSGNVVSSFAITRVGAKKQYYSTSALEARIAFAGHSTDSENYISRVWWEFQKEEGVVIDDFSELTHPLNEPYYINLLPHLSKFSSATTKTIVVYAEDKFGTTQSLDYQVSLVEMELGALEQELLSASDSTSLSYKVLIVGGTNLNTKYLECNIYDEARENLIDTQTFELSPSAVGNRSFQLNIANLPHDSYVLEVQAKGTVGSAKVSSNVLRHKILRQIAGYGTLFDALLPERIEQYSEIPISYLLVTDNTNTYTVEIQLDNNTPIRTTIVAGTLGTYHMASIDKQGIYTLLLTLPDLNIQKQYTFAVEKYTGVLPVIDTARADLQVYLNAAGHSNDLIDRDKWASSADATIGKNYYAQLSDFYYGTVNGWLMDEEGVPHLKLSQGAKLQLKNYQPFLNNPLAKTASNLGMTIELDFKLSGVTDFDAELISCYSTNRLGEIAGGFAITGNKAKLYHNNKNDDESCIKFSLVENKRIRLTYRIEPGWHPSGFPMILSYLNGICSNVEAYEAGVDNMQQSDNAALFKIDATHGEVSLYSVRFYNNAIDEAVILNNYQASFASKEERQRAYENNLILDANGNINLELIEAEDYNLQIPYVKITGGYGCDKKFKMKENDGSTTFALPVGKKDYRLIDIEVHYPHTDYFAGYGEKDENGKPTYKFIEKCTFDDETLDVTTGFGLTPKTGALMYCQGTSSMEYPVKNLRVKFKSKNLQVRPDLPGVELVCFKADYMDSSGAHNTGAANLIDSLYEGIHIQTPAQEHFSDEKLVTCIKGHPCIIFWSPTGAPGSYQFIGKYNLNLDKATPEPFGFKHSSADTDLEASDTVTEADIKFGYLLNEDGTISVSDGKKENAIYCYEFLDNKVKVCNFLVDEDMPGDDGSRNYHNTWYQLYWNKDEEKYLAGWTKGFESRYPEDRLGDHDADNLYELASWLNELQILRETDEATALQRFKLEYETYFNKDFLLSYYVITQALLMMDSRVKNMMIATWGKERRTYTDINGIEQTVYRWIWYPIFYDMDTMLGLNNQGKPRWSYDDDDSNPECFNGNDVIWHFVRDTLPGEIQAYYNAMEQSGGLTTSGILPRFNDNQGTMANEAMYNQDCKYKYIEPYRTRYYDYLNKVWIDPGDMLYLYAAQGSRAMDREYFITNRVLYLSGKYVTTNYWNNKNNYITFRVNDPATANVEDAETMEKIRKTLAAVPNAETLAYRSLKTGYAGTLIGANGQVDNYRFNGEQTIDVACDTSGAGNTEAYLLGVNILSDVGDLSATYPEKFLIGGAIDCRLKKLQLGNKHRDYFNHAWAGTDPIGLSNCPYLSEFDMSNCSEYRQPLSFESNKVIERIYLTGSGTTSVILPTGGILQELRLPSMNALRIDSHPLLTDKTFTFGYYDYEAENEILPEKNHWVNDFSTLRELQIIDTNIDSYNIVCNAPQLEYYELVGFDWHITAENAQDIYIYVGIANTIPEDQRTRSFFLYDGQSGTYVPYTGSFEDEEHVYIVSKWIDETGTITEIPVLELLKTLRTIDEIDKAVALMGTITIDLDADVDEFNIFYKYNNIYPNVQIVYGDNANVTEAYAIEFYGSDSYSSGMTPYASYLNNGMVTWKELTQNLTDPVKLSDPDNHYTFNGVWKEVGGEQEEFDLKALANTKPPERDLKLIPVFVPSTRLYDVEFYDDNGKKIEHLSTALTYSATESVASRLADKPIYFHYKAYTGNLEHGRWALKGWISKSDFDNHTAKPTPIDLSKKYVTDKEKLQFYAYYVEEDARLVPTDIRCFGSAAFSEPGNSDGRGAYDGYYIYVKDAYQEVLQGRITLPSFNATNQPLISIGKPSVSASTEISSFTPTAISELYLLPDSQYVVVGAGALAKLEQLRTAYLRPTVKEMRQNAFFESAKLQYIYTLDPVSNNVLSGDSLPPNLTYIGANCFARDAFSTGFEMQLHISRIPDSVSYIGQSAFYQGGPNITITALPAALETLNSYVFYRCTNVYITSFGSQDPTVPGASQLKAMHTNALGYAGVGYLGETTPLVVGASVQTLHVTTSIGYGGEPFPVSVFENYGRLNENTPIGKYTLVLGKDKSLFALSASDTILDVFDKYGDNKTLVALVPYTYIENGNVDVDTLQ